MMEGMITQFSLTLAGLAFFFGGLAGAKSGFRNLATPRMRRVIQRIASHPFLAAIWGLVAGGIAQSATGVGFILTGLVAAGAISISVALVVIVFANLGTTLLVYVASVDTRNIAYILIGIGGLLGGLAPFRQYRVALHLVGSVGSLFLGLLLLREVGSDLPGNPWFESISVVVGGSAIGAFLMGLGLRIFIQSTSAIALVAMAFVLPGLFTESQVLLLIHGATIGVGVSTLILGRSLRGIPRRIILFQSIINLAGGAFLAVLWIGDRTLDVPLVASFLLDSAWLPDEYRLPTGFLIQQVTVATIGLLFLPFAPRILASLSPTTAAEHLATPEFLSATFVHDVSTSRSLVSSEQRRLIRHLPSLLDAIAADSNGDQRSSAETADGIAQLSTEISMFLQEILANGLDSTSASEILNLRHQQMEINDLVAATLEFSQSVEAIHNESNNAGSVRIAVAMTEGLHLLLSMLGRAVSGEVGDASVLRILTSDSGGITEQIRGEIASGSVLDDGTRLLAAGAYFERAVWILGRLQLDLVEDLDPGSDLESTRVISKMTTTVEPRSITTEAIAKI
jgi:phosphate:Na+ symporter